MDVREKLVEIVCDATQINGCIHSCNHPPCAMVRGIVDALIQNGVTVQEWISVKDRLPELGERVICTDGDAVFEQYRVEHSCVYGMWDRCGLKSPMQEVTHWMPMPKPPKGE